MTRQKKTGKTQAETAGMCRGYLRELKVKWRQNAENWVQWAAIMKRAKTPEARNNQVNYFVLTGQTSVNV
jgi:hypothetical protein